MADAPNAWFRDAVFNLLVDYYPEVPYRPYGSGATDENVLPVLDDLRLGFVIIYAKGHSGITTFRSRLRTEHLRLGRDMPEAFRRLTRETGTRLFLYYSGLLDGLAGERHPDWRQLDRSLQAAHFFTEFEPCFHSWAICPLSDYFAQWVEVHLEELLGRYSPDGIWVDGDWAGPCYCPRCEARFRAESGYDGPWPPKPAAEPAWRRTWAGITHDWRTRFAARVRELKPDCLYSAGNVSPRAEYAGPFDWRSGDWFSPNNHRVQQSIVMRRYTTSDLPYDAMTCDTSFVHRWRAMRSRTKPLDRLLQEGAGILANGGVWCYWTYPRGDGALVPSKMRQASAAARFARERAPWVLHTESAAWVGIVDTLPFGVADGRGWGAGKALIELHRSPDLLDEQQLDPEGPYRLLVLPEPDRLHDAVVARLEAFVRGGGRLLVTGSASTPALQKLLGVERVEPAALSEGHVMLADGEPAAVYQPWDRLAPAGADELYPLYLAWDHWNHEARHIAGNWPMHAQIDEEHPEPAGTPAATLRRLGDGLAVHVPTALFNEYWVYGYPELRAWLRELLAVLDPEPPVWTDAHTFVELSVRRRDDTLLVHFVNGNPGRDLAHVGTMDLWTDEVPAVGPYRVRVRCAAPPRSARWQPEGIDAELTWSDGVAEVVLPRLHIHTCLVLEGATP